MGKGLQQGGNGLRSADCCTQVVEQQASEFFTYFAFLLRLCRFARYDGFQEVALYRYELLIGTNEHLIAIMNPAFALIHTYLNRCQLLGPARSLSRSTVTWVRRANQLTIRYST